MPLVVHKLQFICRQTFPALGVCEFKQAFLWLKILRPVQQKIASTAAGQWRFLEPLWVCSCGGRLLCQGGRWEFGAGGVQEGIPPAIPPRGRAGSSF